MSNYRGWVDTWLFYLFLLSLPCFISFHTYIAFIVGLFQIFEHLSEGNVEICFGLVNDDVGSCDNDVVEIEGGFFVLLPYLLQSVDKYHSICCLMMIWKSNTKYACPCFWSLITTITHVHAVNLSINNFIVIVISCFWKFYIRCLICDYRVDDKITLINNICIFKHNPILALLFLLF